MKIIKYHPSEKIHDLREMLEKSTARYAEKPLFYQKIDGVFTPFTYSRYRADVRSLGAAFLRRGLQGKRVILIGENSYAWCVSYMTVVCGLGVIVPTDKEIPAEELANIAKLSGASAIIFSEKQREKATAAGKRLQKYSFDDILDICSREDVCSEEDYELYDNLSIDIDTMCTLIFTSGTTGTSKGVMLSQRNICTNLENLALLIGVDHNDTALSVLPLHHVYECTTGFLFPIFRGASVAFSEGVRYIMKNMKEARPTKMLCVPLLVETMYNKIWANIRKKGIESKVRNVIKATDMIMPESMRIAAKRRAFAEIHNSFGGKLEMIIIGGAPIDPQVMKGMRDFGFKVVQGYGLTECAPLAAVNPDTAPKDHSAGVALPGGELKIFRPGEDGIGEICYRGDNVMLGYYKMPDATAEVKKSGWLHTGDLGYIDSDGYLVITGRKKNIIVTSNGKNIFPEELETYLSRSKFVAECVVLGMMNEKKKDYDIVAVVYPDFEYAREALGAEASDESLTAVLSEAVDQVNGLVQSYKRIDLLLLRDTEFPKNSSRKIKRMGLSESIEEEYLALRG